MSNDSERLARLEARVSQLEKTLSGVCATLMQYKGKIERLPDDEDPPILEKRVEALEHLAEKADYWIGRQANEAQCFGDEFGKAFRKVDWRYGR